MTGSLRAFVDLDGVLVDLLPAWLKLRGFKMLNPWPNGKYNLPDLYPVRPHEVWEGCDEKWWAELPPTPDARMIVETVKRYVGSIYLITNPVVTAGATGKIHWISKHFPEFSTRWMMSPCRQVLANDDTFLIDDQSNNVDLFREFGGRGILLPRMWNRRFAQSHDAVSDLSRCLDHSVTAYSVGAWELTGKEWT